MNVFCVLQLFYPVFRLLNLMAANKRSSWWIKGWWEHEFDHGAYKFRKLMDVGQGPVQPVHPQAQPVHPQGPVQPVHVQHALAVPNLGGPLNRDQDAMEVDN